VSGIASRVPSLVKAFKAPKKSLGNLDAEAAAMLIMVAADIALIIDDQGVIRDVSFNSEELSRELEGYEKWLGSPWAETVTAESRPKVEAILREAASKADPRWRHVNQVSGRGTEVPVLYSAARVGDGGRVVAFGRDLRAISALQQRLMDAQQSMERDYSRLRHVETRYRLLFQTSHEPVLILDALTQKVVEANPATHQLFGGSARRVIGRPFPDVFEADSVPAIQSLLGGVRAAGRADDVKARLADGSREVLVSASLFRQENSSLFLVRLSLMQADDDATAVVPKTKSKLLKLVESAPDAFVVTGPDGRIMVANAAFVDMAQIATEEQARGESLERWVGRPGVDVNVLIANLRQRGSVRLFSTTLRGEYGASTDVEISAVSVMNGGKPCFGFTIRNVGRRLSVDSQAGRELPRSVEQLTELIGRVSLKELVREATDVIERLCIEAALELTNDNRATAAEMLGLSRQSLYVKLRRYGLGDLSTDGGT